MTALTTNNYLDQNADNGEVEKPLSKPMLWLVVTDDTQLCLLSLKNVQLLVSYCFFNLIFSRQHTVLLKDRMLKIKLKVAEVILDSKAFLSIPQA